MAQHHDQHHHALIKRITKVTNNRGCAFSTTSLVRPLDAATSHAPGSRATPTQPLAIVSSAGGRTYFLSMKDEPTNTTYLFDMATDVSVLPPSFSSHLPPHTPQHGHLVTHHHLWILHPHSSAERINLNRHLAARGSPSAHHSGRLSEEAPLTGGHCRTLPPASFPDILDTLLSLKLFLHPDLHVES